MSFPLLAVSIVYVLTEVRAWMRAATTATPATAVASGGASAGFALVFLLGFIGAPIFVLLFLLLYAREKPWIAVVYAVAAFLFVYAVFRYVLAIPITEGIIFNL